MAMQKVYNRINWENYPILDTPINKQNLNKIDVATDELDNRVITHENVKATKEEVAPLIKEIGFNPKTGVFTITRKNGSSFTIDTLLEKIQTNWDYDPNTQKLILTMEDGTTQAIDLSELITEFEFVDTATIDFSVDNSGKVSAIVKEGSINEKHLRPDYLADIKVESAKAEAARAAAEVSEANAKKSENAAAKSASDSANSASESSDSADASAASAAAALASQNAAKASETAAKNSQTAAKTSETNAKASETAAKNSETNAGKSAIAAAGSATAAATSAAESAESAENAATSETNAGKSATAAATSEKNAKTSENNATTQATAAKNSATSAATSASTATTKAGEAATSATNAKTSAETATSQATAASNSASTASTQATNAKNSAKQAANSAKLSQSYSEGGTGSRQGEDTDNAKEYARQAKASADKAAEIVAGDYIPSSQKGMPNGVATLDESGKVPTTQLPDNIGKVQSVNGKTGAVTVTKADVGLGNVGNFKAVSTVANQGLSATEQSNARTNIGITVVNNTADSAKRVAYATSAGTATDNTKLPLAGGTMTGQINCSSGGSWISSWDNAPIRNTMNPNNGSKFVPMVASQATNGRWLIGTINDTLNLAYLLNSRTDNGTDGVFTFYSNGIMSGKASTAGAAETAELLRVQPDNYKDANALPSTYPRGETVFFSNNPTNKFNGISYCTINTIKGYSNMACIQFLYPYYTNGDTIYYRTAIYNSDTWRAWQTIATTAQIPTSLPANGGNANTLGGKAASAFLEKTGGTISGGLNVVGEIHTGVLTMGGTGYNSNTISSTSGIHLHPTTYIYLRTATYCLAPNNTQYLPIYASSFVNQSSRRFKENFEKLTEDESEKLLQIPVYHFDYINGVKNQSGFIAEDIEPIYPEICSYQTDEETGEEELFGLDYSKFVPYIVKQLQVQNDKIAELQNKINELESRIGTV